MEYDTDFAHQGELGWVDCPCETCEKVREEEIKNQEGYCPGGWDCFCEICENLN